MESRETVKGIPRALLALGAALLFVVVGIVIALLRGNDVVTPQLKPQAHVAQTRPERPPPSTETAAEAATKAPPSIPAPPERHPSAAEPVRAAEQPRPRVRPGIAPAAVPRAILDEPDPQRRAQMLARHRLAVARSRLAIFRRRQRFLSTTVARAKVAKAPLKRIQLLERQLADLAKEITEAEAALAKADAELRDKNGQ